MKKIKDFINQRSKILLISSITSFVLFSILMPEFVYYSNFIKHVSSHDYISLEMATESIGELIWSTHSTEAIQEFNLMFSCIFVFIALFNMVGYVYKKNEFIFISIGLSIVVTCMSIYVTSKFYILLILLATILNAIGYVEQNRIIKKGK